MFENNLFVDAPSSSRGNESVSRPLFGLSTKSSVKVSLPIEDEEFSEQHAQVHAPSTTRKDPAEVLGRFRNYVKFHAIETDDIWEEKASLQYLLFADVVQKKLGFKFTTEQVLSLKAISQNGNLNLCSFNNLDIWPQRSSLKKSIFTVASQKSLFEIKKKRNSSVRNLIKPQSRKNDEQSFIVSKQFTRSGGEKMGGDKSRMKTTCDQLTKTFLKFGFATEECRDNKIEALREDLEMNALEKKWELVAMAGEMNKWILDSLSDTDRKNNRAPVMFKVVNQAENFTVVKVDEHKREEIIPQVVFYKKYHALKKQQPASKDIRPKISQAIVGVIGSNPCKTPSNKCSQRDKELNEALLHIMRIQNILQYQHKILTESAINT